MNQSKHSHHPRGEPDRDSVPHEHRPYWVRAHRDWKFWGAVFLMLAAMMVYAMTYNLPRRARAHAQQPLSGPVGK